MNRTNVDGELARRSRLRRAIRAGAAVPNALRAAAIAVCAVGAALAASVDSSAAPPRVSPALPVVRAVGSRVGSTGPSVPDVAAQAASTSKALARAQNQEGVRLLGRGDFEKAVEALEEAVRLDPFERVYRKNLAAALTHVASRSRAAGDPAHAAALYLRAQVLEPEEDEYRFGRAVALFEAKDLYAARATLEELLSRRPGHARAAELVGEIHYQEGRLENALSAWEIAVAAREQEGAGPEAGERLEARIAAARRELEVEGKLHLETSAHFDVRAADDERGRRLARMAAVTLERIGEEGGRLLGTYPRDRIQVILYTKADFVRVTNTHGWVGGLFDGKIRVPVPEGADAADGLERVLRHELAHWAIHRRTPNAPAWLHEGIAQWFEGEDAASSLATIRFAAKARSGGAELGSDVVERLRDLGYVGAAGEIGDSPSSSGDGIGLASIRSRELSPRSSATPGAIRLAYAHAHAFVAYLAKTFGDVAIARILDRMEEGNSEDDAFRSTTGLTIDDLESRFRDTL
jgi:tetratricopeptide (TPR) repeat protein